MSQQEILVIGAAVVDRIYYVTRLPKPGETAIGSESLVYPGGKGANQALAARKMNANITLITAVGKDEAAEIVLSPLRDAGVNLDQVIHMEGLPTAEASISVDSKGENQIVACPGAYHKIKTSMLYEKEQVFKDADWLLIQNELPRDIVDTAIELAMANKCKIVFNPAPFKKYSRIPHPGIDLIIPNEIEAAGMIGVDDYLNVPLSERIRFWQSLQAGNVLVTLGGYGGEWYDNQGKRKEFNAPKVETVDTVGAGDAFCGILTAMLSQGKELEEALKYASYGAALTTTRKGAQSGLPDLPELLAFLEEMKEQ